MGPTGQGEDILPASRASELGHVEGRDETVPLDAPPGERGCHRWARLLDGELFATSSRVKGAMLLHRTFGFEALRCPKCVAKTHPPATVPEPATWKKILAHLGVRTGRASGCARAELHFQAAVLATARTHVGLAGRRAGRVAAAEALRCPTASGKPSNDLARNFALRRGAGRRRGPPTDAGDGLTRLGRLHDRYRRGRTETVSRDAQSGRTALSLPRRARRPQRAQTSVSA